MGLFSFTEEQWARYEARKPVDPGAIAADAWERISASREAKADAWVARLGPRAAWERLAEADAPRVADVRHAIDAIARRAPLGTPEAIGEGAARDAWLATPNAESAVLRTRADLAKQFRQIREERRNAYADRAATGAVAALARLDRAEPTE